jgi:hypothetical protein
LTDGSLRIFTEWLARFRLQSCITPRPMVHNTPKLPIGHL